MSPLAFPPSDPDTEQHETNVEAIPQPSLPTPLSHPLDSPSVSELAGFTPASASARLRCKIPGLPDSVREITCYHLESRPDDDIPRWLSAVSQSDVGVCLVIIAWAVVMIATLRRQRRGGGRAVGLSAHRIWSLPAEEESGVSLEDCDNQ